MKISSFKVLDNKVKTWIKINNSEITEIKTKLKPNKLASWSACIFYTTLLRFLVKRLSACTEMTALPSFVTLRAQTPKEWGKKWHNFFFQQDQLKVTVDTILIQPDFLDVTLNLCTGRYWPYRKPNDQPLYINVQSNHPPTITKKLPYMIVKRISDISCDVDAFSSSLPAYEEALKQSGHKIQPLPFERAVGRNKRRQKSYMVQSPI